METLKNGIWYPEAIGNDLIEQGGLSAKSVGIDIMDTTGKRFFYNKIPFAVVAWRKDEYLILAFASEFSEDDIKKVGKAFCKVVGYYPFVRYESYQQKEAFRVVEWAKNDADMKFIDIMKVDGVRNLKKGCDDFVGALA